MKTILIVDDEPGQARSLRIGLQGKGYRIMSAEDGKAAFRVLSNKETNIDMVITDYAMPGMNGLELLKKIRESAVSIPVIMMTAHGEKSLIIDALRNQCDSFIEKPFTLEELAAEIENVRDRLNSRSGAVELKNVLPRVVHQINNPLMQIRGHAELGILNSLKDQAGLSKNFKSIIDATEKIKSLNKQIIGLGRMQKEKTEVVEIIGVIEEVITMFSGVMKLKDVFLEKKFECDRMYIHGSRYGLEQVFNNLLMNAMDAMEKKEEKVLRIKVNSHLEKSSIRICIEDSGCGVSENDKLHIFEPYFSAKAGGNGLGLAVVKEIINRQGGEIEMESIVDRGTTFTIDLLQADSRALEDNEYDRKS